MLTFLLKVWWRPQDQQSCCPGSEVYSINGSSVASTVTLTSRRYCQSCELMEFPQTPAFIHLTRTSASNFMRSPMCTGKSCGYSNKLNEEWSNHHIPKLMQHCNISFNISNQRYFIKFWINLVYLREYGWI